MRSASYLTYLRTEADVAAFRRNNWPVPSSGSLADLVDKPGARLFVDGGAPLCTIDLS